MTYIIISAQKKIKTNSNIKSKGNKYLCVGFNIGGLISEEEIILGAERCIELEEAERRRECISGRGNSISNITEKRIYSVHWQHEQSSGREVG